MEFLRFGSSIPGSYWGCCAIDIIQYFNVDPDAKASIQLVYCDNGSPITRGKDQLYAGPTWRDIFKARIRIGTFSQENMANHGFLCVLEGSQISYGNGKKWLEILREEGFEFIRAIDNSVYTGSNVSDAKKASHTNYLFGLFRNIASGRIDDPFKAPEAWSSLPDPYNGDMSPSNMTKVQRERWKTNNTKLITEKDMSEEDKQYIWMAGVRNKYPQERRVHRNSRPEFSKQNKAKNNAFPAAAVTEAEVENG